MHPLTVHRRSIPFARRLTGIWRYVFNPHGLAVVLGLGFVLWLFSFGGMIGAALAVGAFWGTLFSAIRQSGRGLDEIETPEFDNMWDDLFNPAIGGLVGTGFLWVPGLLYWLHLPASATLWKEPVFWALVFAGIAYAPMALMSAAANSGVLRLLNPLIIGAYIKRLGADYALAVAAIGVLAVLEVFALALSAVVSFLPLPIISSVLGWSVRVIAPLAMARTLGLLLRVRGDDLGWGVPSDYQVLLLPGVEPRGVPPPPAGHSDGTPASARWAPIDLDEAAPFPPHEGPPAPPARRAPVELDESQLPPLQADLDPAQDPVGAVTAAIACNQLPRAVELYEAANLLDESFTADAHLAVGQHAATTGKLDLAVRALKAAARDPAGPLASRALVLMARVYGEKLGNAQAAAKLYEHVVRNYPGTPAAHYAQARLTPPNEK